MGPVGHSKKAKSPAEWKPVDAWRGTGPWLGGLHVFVLFSFALVQPLFDVLGRDAAFFVARGIGPVDLCVFAFLLLVIPTALASLTILACGAASPLSGFRALVIWLGLAVAASVLSPVQRLGVLPGVGAIVASLATGAFAGWLYWEWIPFRRLLTLLVPAPFVFTALFLGFSNASGIVFPREVESWPAVDVTSETSVLVVVCDELPLSSLLADPGRIDENLFPNFARLAGDSIWFRNATACDAATAQAVPSIVTGRRATEPGTLPLASEYPGSLFTMLGGSHRMVVKEAVTQLCPDELLYRSDSADLPVHRMLGLLEDTAIVYGHVLLPSDLAGFLPSVTENWSGFRHPVTEESGYAKRPFVFHSFVDAIAPSDEPTLYYLHINLPHVPWMFLEDGTSYRTAGNRILPGGTKGRWRDDPRLPALAYQRHLLQLGYLDRLLGQLLAKLDETGLYDPLLITLVSDHGASFRPGFDRRVPTAETARAILHVPWFLKLPGSREARINDENVEMIDVLPTLADALDIRLPWPLDGRAVLDETTSPRSQKIIYHKGEHPIAVDGALPERFEALEEKQRLFGVAPTWDDVYALEADDKTQRPLLGRSVGELEVMGTRDGVRVQLHRADDYENVDPSSGVLPAYVEGTLALDAGAHAPAKVAVAVNGVLRAFASTHALPTGDIGFELLVPPRSFVAGRNAIQLYGMTDYGELVLLARRGYRLVGGEEGDPERFVTTDGQSLPAKAGLAGVVESVRRDGELWIAIGWAADVERKLPANAVLVVIEGREEALLRPIGHEKRALVERLGPEAGRSGFRVALGEELFDSTAGEGPPHLRVFALFDDGVIELERR